MDLEKPAILLVGGGEGMGPVEKTVDGVARVRRDVSDLNSGWDPLSRGSARSSTCRTPDACARSILPLCFTLGARWCRSAG